MIEANRDALLNLMDAFNAVREVATPRQLRLFTCGCCRLATANMGRPEWANRPMPRSRDLSSRTVSELARSPGCFLR